MRRTATTVLAGIACFLAALVSVATTASPAPAATTSTTPSTTSKFCASAKSFTKTLNGNGHEKGVDAGRYAALANVLQKGSGSADPSVGSAMRTMAAFFTKLSKANKAKAKVLLTKSPDLPAYQAAAATYASAVKLQCFAVPSPPASS
jgi:hypothetical protein